MVGARVIGSTRVGWPVFDLIGSACREEHVARESSSGQSTSVARCQAEGRQEGLKFSSDD
jgi:hypothetical protein